MKRLLLIFAFCLPLTALAEPSANVSRIQPPQEGSYQKPRYGLDICLEKALRQNTDILKAKEDIKRITGLIVEIRAQAIPQVVASTSINQTGSKLSGSLTPTFWTTGIQVQQLVYSGGSVGAAIDAAKLTEQNAFQSLNTVIDGVILAVRQGYYNVLLNRSLIDVQKQSIQLLEEELNNQQRRYAAGTVTRFNVLRAEVELANAQPALIKAKNDYRLAQVGLARLMGVDYQLLNKDEPPFEIIGELEQMPSSYTLEESIQSALKSRPELAIAQRQVEIQKKELTISRSGYMPTVSLYGGYDINSDRTEASLKQENNGWSTGVLGSWNLFDGWMTKGKVDQSKAKLNQATLDVDATRRNIEVEVRQAFSSWQEAIEFIASQGKNVEQAEESLRLANARFDAGAGTQLDILNAQVALTKSRTNKLQALYDYNVAVANLERVTSSPIRLAHKNVTQSAGDQTATPKPFSVTAPSVIP